MGTTPSTAADDGEEEEAGNGGGALPHEQKRAVALSAGGASTSSDDDDDPHGDNDTSGDGEVRKKKEPLVIASMRCGYADLARTVRLIDFGAASASGGASAGGDHGGRRNDRPPLRLSADLAREVIRFLVVEPVRQGEVEVVKQGPPSLNAHGVFSPPYCRLQLPPDKRVRWMSPPPPFAYMPSLLEGAAGGGVRERPVPPVRRGCDLPEARVSFGQGSVGAAAAFGAAYQRPRVRAATEEGRRRVVKVDKYRRNVVLGREPGGMAEFRVAGARRAEGPPDGLPSPESASIVVAKLFFGSVQRRPAA